MKLLITGVTGLLGLNLALDACRAHDVTGVARNMLAAMPFPVIRADLLEADAIRRILDSSRPDAVLHCAAIADIDLCEKNPELAWQTNAALPARMADACARRKIRLVHISTDAVFDGQKVGQYTEADAPRPIGVYASTKHEGEKAVLDVNPLAVAARVNFYGWSLDGRRSLAEFFVSNLSRGNTVSGFTDVTFCPMLVNQLGELLMRILQSKLHGLYHAVGPQALTKYQFGVEIARKFGFREAQIAPQSVEKSGLGARRAHNLWLSSHKLSTDLGLALPEFSTGLSSFYEQYVQGYPQKIRSYQQGQDRRDAEASGTGMRASREGQ